jgi:hypothetical protein
MPTVRTDAATLAEWERKGLVPPGTVAGRPTGKAASLAAPPAVVSVRVLIPTPNPSNQSRQGAWQKAVRLAKQQREAVLLVLGNQPAPPAPWVVTMTRVSAGTLADDALPTALKRVRDSVGVYLLGGATGQRDSDPSITWVCRQARGKRGQPAVDIEIKTRDVA